MLHLDHYSNHFLNSIGPVHRLLFYIRDLSPAVISSLTTLRPDRAAGSTTDMGRAMKLNEEELVLCRKAFQSFDKDGALDLYVIVHRARM